MKRLLIIGVVGLLVAFGLGLWMGSRIQRAPVIEQVVSAPAPPATLSTTSSTTSPPPCMDIQHAGQLAGKAGCVTGLVLRVYASRTGNTFLDFCEDYRTCSFTSVVFAADKNQFGDLSALQGRRVEIRGDVVTYQNHAEIIIHGPHQVRSAQ